MSFSLPIAPPTEEELDKMDLMEPGIYDFELLKSTLKGNVSYEVIILGDLTKEEEEFATLNILNHLECN
jgi:hypothetical protein